MTSPSRSHAHSLALLDAGSLGAGFRAREFSPLEVAEAVLARVEELNPTVNAFVTVTRDLALEQAREAERAFGRADADHPALLGVPYSVKDTIVTAGVRTTMGSRALSEWVPTFDAPAVERCRRAGAVLIGKTNSPEFGWKGETSNPLFGTTTNPWDATRTAGGSSGGAAAAVALGLGPVALGTDAGGSSRIPAAFCGVVGYKPSFGRIPLAPSGPLETLPHLGVLARSVRDIALVLDTVSGPDSRDRLSLPASASSFADALQLPGEALRACWSADLGFATVEPEAVGVAEAAVDVLRRLGWHIADLEADLDDPYEILEILLAAGMAGAHRDGYEKSRPLFDPQRLPLVEWGFDLTAADVGAAIGARGRWVEALRVLLDPYDLLITPSVPLEPFAAGRNGPESMTRGERDGLSWAALSYPFNLSGQPAISLPCGMTAGGLPVGLQLVGGLHADERVIRAAAAFEQANPWADAWPPLAGAGRESPAHDTGSADVG